MYFQKIKRDNEENGTASCKIALYRAFLKYGIKTWEQVIKALKHSGYDEIAEHVELELLKHYSQVMNNVA